MDIGGLGSALLEWIAEYAESLYFAYLGLDSFINVLGIRIHPHSLEGCKRFYACLFCNLILSITQRKLLRF